MIAAWKHRSDSSQAGFTLMEMLVAVTLVAVMAVALWAVFGISIRSWSRGTEFMDANQRHRSILNLVRKQMASAHSLSVLENPEDPGSGSPVFSGTSNSLFFLSLNSLQFQESPGLTLVSYGVEQDSDGNYSLVEKEARFTGQVPGEGASAIGSSPIPIFEKLSSCLFEYFDTGEADNAPQWVQEWDAKNLGRLPLAVSVTMISQDPGGSSFTRHMVVPIQTNEMRLNYPNINPFGSRGPVTR
jgi:general secretion pathway protein J